MNERELNIIWNDLINDKTKIYHDQTLLDVFLANTDVLLPKHFLKLNKADRNKINGNVVYNLLHDAGYYPDLPSRGEMAEILGKENLNKLNDFDINQLLILDYDSNKPEMEDVVIKYKKELNGENVCSLLRWSVDAEKTAKQQKTEK